MMHKSMMRGFFVTNILSIGGAAAAAGANRGTMRLGYAFNSQNEKLNILAEMLQISKSGRAAADVV